MLFVLTEFVNMPLYVTEIPFLSPTYIVLLYFVFEIKRYIIHIIVSFVPIHVLYNMLHAFLIFKFEIWMSHDSRSRSSFLSWFLNTSLFFPCHQTISKLDSSRIVLCLSFNAFSFYVNKYSHMVFFLVVLCIISFNAHFIFQYI